MTLLKKTRVLYLFNTSTHYYNNVLNRLNEETKYEIHLLIPQNKSKHVGDGVFQTKENLKVKYYELEEKYLPYFGCYFWGLTKLIFKIKPKIIILIGCYERSFFFNPIFLILKKILGFKIILKSIPFELPLSSFPCNLNWYYKHKNLGIKKTSKLFLKEIILRWIFNKYDAHVCYVEKAFEIYGSYGVKKEKIFITYNSPDTDILLKANELAKGYPPILPENPFRLVHVGRLVEWKRVDLILNAMKTLTKDYPTLELLVIGEGPMEKSWKGLTRKLDLIERVFFLGGIYESIQLGRYLRSSSIYVLGGMGGLSINDAMCFERPILCSRGDGTETKLVQENENGFFFEEGNHLDLANKINKILKDPSKGIRMGLKSREIIEKDVNISLVIDGYERAFHKVTLSNLF